MHRKGGILRSFLREIPGFVAEGEDDLPEAARDYVERLAAPYFACAAEWYETIGIGVTGASLLEEETRELAKMFAEGELKRSDLEDYFRTAAESSANARSR